MPCPSRCRRYACCASRRSSRYGRPSRAGCSAVTSLEGSGQVVAVVLPTPCAGFRTQGCWTGSSSGSSSLGAAAYRVLRHRARPQRCPAATVTAGLGRGQHRRDRARLTGSGTRCSPPGRTGSGLHSLTDQPAVVTPRCAPGGPDGWPVLPPSGVTVGGMWRPSKADLKAPATQVRRFLSLDVDGRG